MENANQHFFQPLLPGFQNYLKIPVQFFSRHIKGKHEGKPVNVRSDASEKTWSMKMAGQRLIDGWKEFVEAHDLRVGDFVVFRHEGDMKFHVTALGPSFCEIQYSQSRNHQEEEDEETDESESSSESEKEVEDNVKTKSNQFSSDLTCFTQSVTASNLSTDKVGVPIAFAKRNGLNKGSTEIVLMNEEGNSWDSELKCLESTRVFIVNGWTSFCKENKLQVGDSCTFKLLENNEKPVFRLCSRKNEKTEENRFVLLTPTPYSFKFGRQNLPVSFTRENGINKPGTIIMVDKTGDEWSMELKVDQKNRSMYIWSGNVWKDFCVKNGVNAYESVPLELIRGGTSPLLKFCSNMEQIPFESVARTHKRARVQGLSQETGPKLRTREKMAANGESSRITRSRANQGNLRNTQPSSVSDQVANVKQNVVDTLTSIRLFLTELETMEHRLKDSLQEFNNLGSCSHQREEDNENENETTSSSDN